MTRTGRWLCLIVMFPLCTEASPETTLKYGTTQSWREEPMLEWNGSYHTLNKYDNEAGTTDCQGGYLCYTKRTVGRLEVNNTASVRVESGLQQHRAVDGGRGGAPLADCGNEIVLAGRFYSVHVMCVCYIDKCKFHKERGVVFFSSRV